MSYVIAYPCAWRRGRPIFRPMLLAGLRRRPLLGLCVGWGVADGLSLTFLLPYSARAPESLFFASPRTFRNSANRGSCMGGDVAVAACLFQDSPATMDFGVFPSLIDQSWSIWNKVGPVLAKVGRLIGRERPNLGPLILAPNGGCEIRFAEVWGHYFESSALRAIALQQYRSVLSGEEVGESGSPTVVVHPKHAVG